MFLVLHVFTFVILVTSEQPEWHMKPFGSHRKADRVDETYADNMISPKDFAEKYVIQRKPLVFRDVVKSWPAYSLWTDEYLTEHYGDMEMRLEGKKEKRTRTPKGDVCLGRDRLKTFLKDYKKGANKYIVSDLPVPMYKDVEVLSCMSCGEFVDNFVEIDIWVNSDMGKKGNGGNSLLHKDAFNTVNCVVNGSKEWKLVELKYNDYMYQSWEGPLEAGYGGFSVMDPERVDATKFPDVAKIPKWQFTRIEAGDCIYLPSQMWHQVKSYGETNRAVAMLFSMFNEQEKINTSNCPAKTNALPLSDIDVDLQYPGTGLMPMGHPQVSSVKKEVVDVLVSEKTGYITKKSASRTVYMLHSAGYINKRIILQKAKSLYEYLLNLVNGDATRMTRDFFFSLTKKQFRPLYDWLYPTEPANSYTFEYSQFTPEGLIDILEDLKQGGNGVIRQTDFINEYCNSGGTEKFAKEFWERLAQNAEEISNYSATIEHACEKYNYYRRDNPDEEFSEDDRITTPQGHKSLPKSFSGGYTKEQHETKTDDVNQREEL